MIHLKKLAEGGSLTSGEAGIRTLGTREGTPVFKTGAFGRSATSPDVKKESHKDSLHELPLESSSWALQHQLAGIINLMTPKHSSGAFAWESSLPYQFIAARLWEAKSNDRGPWAAFPMRKQRSEDYAGNFIG